MSERRMAVPTYRELCARTDAPPGSSWGIFGADDEIGAVNFLTEDRVLAGARCITRGAVFTLDEHLAETARAPVAVCAN